jgi:hypothetical protein
VAKPSKKPVTAFVMMNVAPGQAHYVARKHLWTWKKPGKPEDYVKGAYVRAAWVVTGTDDVIARLEADTNAELLELVTAITTPKSPTLITGTRTAMAEDGPWFD